MKTEDKPLDKPLSELDAVRFIKFLNGRRGWHGNMYRSACGRWLAKNLKNESNGAT